VRLILEGDYLTEEKAAADPFALGGANEVNRELFAALRRARVDELHPACPTLPTRVSNAPDPRVRRTRILTGRSGQDVGDHRPGPSGEVGVSHVGGDRVRSYPSAPKRARAAARMSTRVV
jgi:hypothetical protein